jgi:hypothetical protein
VRPGIRQEKVATIAPFDAVPATSVPSAEIVGTIAFQSVKTSSEFSSTRCLTDDGSAVWGPNLVWLLNRFSTDQRLSSRAASRPGITKANKPIVTASSTIALSASDQ